MHKLYYQFPGTWFGDCMPFGKGDEFFLYHQRDNRNPEPFGEPFEWDLATTTDFVHYKDCGVAVPRGGDDEQDQFIFAGSVFEEKASTTSSTPATTATIRSRASPRRCSCTR